MRFFKGTDNSRRFKSRILSTEGLRAYFENEDIRVSDLTAQDFRYGDLTAGDLRAGDLRREDLKENFCTQNLRGHLRGDEGHWHRQVIDKRDKIKPTRATTEIAGYTS